MSKIDLLQGTLDMLVLKTLARGSMHGYEIANSIQQISDDALKVEEGSLYPALYRMEGKGWVKSEWGVSENNRKARYYQLTKSGRKQLETQQNNWARLSEAISKVMQTA
ncbi:MAG TPA: PadR family transcriptional regulator [Blastocatellia bacterium]|nr:PadR family transcriptional regulator [Blastocatellia bacterium]